MIHRFDEFNPEIHLSAWIAPGADVLGRVSIGADSSIWFRVVLRGDVHYIQIGERTNIQDGSVIHVTSGVHPCIVDNDVTVGHSVTLHGCHVKSGALIGMGSIILDEAVIGEGSMVAAGSLVTPRTIVPPNSFVLGSPAKVRRLLTAEESRLYAESPPHYVELARKYAAMGVQQRAT